MTKIQQNLDKDFKQALRRVASTVSIITAEKNGERLGMTATSVTCLSFDPMSMLVCVHKSSKFHDIIMGAEQFCINILSSPHKEISNNFSNPGNDKDQFIQGEWLEKDGFHYLNNAQANLFITTTKIITYGTHNVFIGDVLDVQYTDAVMPLLYTNGGYGQVLRD